MSEKLIYVEGSDNTLRNLTDYFNILLKGNNIRFLFRGNGLVSNLKWSHLFSTESDYLITNDEVMLDNLRYWNKETQTYDIFFFLNGELVRLQDTTNKKIRLAHNIGKLYFSSEIGQAKLLERSNE